MNNKMLRFFLLAFLLVGLSNFADAQKKKTTKKTTPKKAKMSVSAAAPSTVPDTTAAVAPAPPPSAPPPPDTFPVKKVLPSMKQDQAVIDVSPLRDRTPLSYEHLRTDDVVFRYRLWREIDSREKMNLPFLNASDADNGNQRFISILFQALADSTKGITAFSSLDDRFTTPLTRAEIAKKLAGAEVQVPIVDSVTGIPTGQFKTMINEQPLDSFYRFHIKEEVVFDKESSRLFWRILGIAPLVNIQLSDGSILGQSEAFWLYYPDLRPIFATYQVYNGKNFGPGMTWEELFENRMFSGRIYKSSNDNFRDVMIKDIPGFKGNDILQLLEGENIKNKIQNAEQNVWSY